jgi:hypothetical protein
MVRVWGSVGPARLEEASRKDSRWIMSSDMLLVHSRTCRRMYARNVSDSINLGA